jgi:hypothetical protein
VLHESPVFRQAPASHSHTDAASTPPTAASQVTVTEANKAAYARALVEWVLVGSQVRPLRPIAFQGAPASLLKALLISFSRSGREGSNKGSNRGPYNSIGFH